jgi:hypothetical protein
MRSQSFNTVTLTEIDQNIIFANYPNDLNVHLETAKEIVSNRLEFTGNSDHYVIVDMTNVKKVTPEAKAYMQHPEGGLKNILGAAFLANNPVSALLANIFVKTPKSFEARFFHKKEDAINWLKECMRRRQELIKAG